MMKSKLKKIAISGILIIVINLLLSNALFYDMGIENPHVGLLFVFGLTLGPYGALGATLGNIVLDYLNGFTPIEILPSVIITFAVSYLAYKLWYSGFATEKVTKPRLDSVEHLTLFLLSIVICGLVYASAHANLIGIFLGIDYDEYFFVSYFLNFVNLAFIFGIITIWISKRFDFVDTPKISKRKANNKLYQIVFSLLMIVTVLSAIILMFTKNVNALIVLTAIIGILLYIYLTRPLKHEIQKINENTVTEKIIRNFLIITLTIAILGISVSVLSYNFITDINNVNWYLYMMPGVIMTDVIIILFFVPGIIILRYIDKKVIKPISSFSEIESFIGKNKRIEAEGLLNIYSKYTDEKTEIGNLARSYSDLININNEYIENIQEIEGEKERIKAELDIATRIQESTIPTETIENDDFLVNGYSKPAKEVGGDFLDYYNIDDEHLAIVIGDASGKGVPAAILAMISQVMIKQLIIHDNDPSKILYLLNNQLCENNSESMFLTVWLGIYNRTTNELIFSNAGHNPPLIKENGKFRYMNIESGLVIGVLEDFEYINEKITLTDELMLYTDGITDANNRDNAMYGDDRLLDFLNGFESNSDPIDPLLNDISNFTGDAQQFDDMTLLHLRIK